jgi:predicted transcriptional regulator
LGIAPPIRRTSVALFGRSKLHTSREEELKDFAKKNREIQREIEKNTEQITSMSKEMPELYTRFARRIDLRTTLHY